MPGRFANLEFDDSEKRVTKESTVVEKKYDADTYLAQANGEYRWGRFEQALRLYTRALDRSGPDARATRRMSRSQSLV
jgi:hypothetical protein